MDMPELDVPAFPEAKTLLAEAAIRGARILITVILVLVFIRLMKIVSRKIVEYAQDDDHTTQSEREKRAATLAHLLRTSSNIFAVTIGCLMVLREFGLNILPLLTGAGIIGVALGFGSQSIIKDFLNGFFILMENSFRVGDLVTLGDHHGQVEKMTLRTTLLRDIEGVLHIVPNGEIKSIRNHTHGWSQVKLDIGVAYEADLEQVMQSLRETGESLHRDPRFGSMIIDPPEVLGIESFGDSQVIVRVIAKTRPEMQMDVAREFRKRIRESFRRLGIEAPYPHRVVIGIPGGEPSR